MRTNKPITVSLGKQQSTLDALLASGEFDSASEAVRAGLRALERERDVVDEIMRAKIREALDDPGPSIPAKQVFSDLRAFHEQHVKAASRDA